MNKRYSLLGLFLGTCSLLATAQRDACTTSIAPSIAGVDQRPAEPAARGGGSVVWTEDFANGFAGNNPSGAWTTDGADGSIWRVNSNGPRGAYTLATERITSTTWQNGFAKFASDSANCTWSNGTPTALPASSFMDWDGKLVSPLIDLSASPNVEIVYQQRSRWCCGDSPFYLEVSADGGSTWPTRFLANEGNPINQGAPGTGTTSAVTETRRFSLAAAIAEGPSTVRFRFTHDSEAGTSHYYWQLDDIQIMVLPEYEINIANGYTSTTGTGEEYGRIPFTQLPGSMNIGAEVVNYGSATQTNVSVECVVRNEDGVAVLTQTTNLGDMTTGISMVSDDNANLPFLDLGKYTATFTVQGDQVALDGDTTDNQVVRHFEVTSDQYSIDALGNHPTGTEVRTQLGTASFTDNAEVYFMSLYPIMASTEGLSATVLFGANTRAGGEIEVFMLDTADVLATPASVTNAVDGVYSDIVEITQQHVTAGRITLPFQQSIPLPPGGYFLCARISGSGTSATTNDAEVYIADDETVPQPGIASMIYLPVDFNDDGTEGQHRYGNGTAFAIRLNVTPATAVEETAELTGVSMYPNPTKGILNIRSESTDRMRVEVLDVLGAMVHTTSFNGRTTIDLSGMAQGLYSVRISNGVRTVVERITVQ